MVINNYEIVELLSIKLRMMIIIILSMRGYSYSISISSLVMFYIILLLQIGRIIMDPLWGILGISASRLIAFNQGLNIQLLKRVSTQSSGGGELRRISSNKFPKGSGKENVAPIPSCRK